jgi:peptidoglycan hydrolase-like protein with peptidoglycan-binding domain
MSQPVDPAAARRASDALRRRRRRRAVTVGGLVVVLAAVAVAASLGLGGRGAPDAPPARTGPAATVEVTRESLVEAVSVAGTLHYGTPVPLACAAAGTVTWLPAVGSTVRRGKPVVRADEKPVLLMYGKLPMYRPLTEEDEGVDVEQLERNLAALGYGGFTVDETFSPATTTAVKRWQEDLGLPKTGTVERERVVFLPGAIRVARWLVRLGAPATADVLSYTGSTRVVTVAADAAALAWAVPGAKVTITLPGGATTAGKVAGVATEAQAPEGGDEPAAANPGTDGATVEVAVSVPNQKALGKLTTAPVDVRYIARERKDVLTVPVSALLALAEGGYGLEVVGPAGARIVPVQVGLFADGRVEVTGDGLDAGLAVGVPE